MVEGVHIGGKQQLAAPVQGDLAQLVGGLHHHIRDCPVTEHTARTGEGILHGEGMKGGNKDIRHISPP